jgi:predicted dehydrogenase
MAPAQEMMFYGEAGSIRLGAPFNAQHFGDVCVELRQPGGRTVCERFNGARQYDLQVAAFNHSALTGDDYPCPLEFSRGTQEMIDMVLANHISLE